MPKKNHTSKREQRRKELQKKFEYKKQQIIDSIKNDPIQYIMEYNISNPDDCYSAEGIYEQIEDRLY